MYIYIPIYVEYQCSYSSVMSAALRHLFKKCCLAAEMIAYVFHVDFCDAGLYNRNVMTHVLLPEMEVKPFLSSEVRYSYFKKIYGI